MAFALGAGEGIWGGRGVGEFGAEGGEVAGDIVGSEGACGLDGDVVACSAEGVGEGMDILGEERFAAGEDDVAACWSGGRFGEDFFDGELCSFGFPRGVGGVTPAATQVAAGGADEERGCAGESPFSLQRMEGFSEVHLVAAEGGRC